MDNVFNPPFTSESPFSCEQLMEDPNSELETTTTDLGNASRCFGQMTFKIFNGRVVPGLILHGIVYLDVTEPVRINKITLTGQSMVKKEISGRKGSTSEYPTNSFKKDIVTSSGGYQRRQPNQYQALTDTWDGTDLMEMLQLPEDFHEDDFQEWPFAGPIPLPPGTHAIPFSIRVAPEVNPTVTYKRKGENRRKAVISHTTNVAVEVAAQSDKGGPMMNIYSDKIPVEIVSCGGLPPVVNGSYVPANVQLVKLSYKDSSALIILERKHFLPGDKVRIIIFTNNKRCLRNAYAELIKSTNLPELELSDNNDVIQAKKAPGIELLDRSKKASPDSRFNKTFISKVGDSYPPEDTNTAPNGRLNRNMDDKSLMPEAQRQAGCTLELKVPKDAEPSIEVGDNRIRYHVRTHLNVRNQRKTESQAQLITVGEQLRHNYTLKYIKFIK
ncbi:unnamed protein product [Mesocestoides corti]|uniref:Uncharacterized protein n=2 Tax=Mesocestoides corti TaxID=53468 RepID=A0A3P6I0Q8_MESCO|nr:unnamed protein product [Mesocestoides corti]